MTDIQIKHYNGTAWAELFPKTKARITELNSGKTVEAAIGELVSSLSSKVTIEQVDAEIEKNNRNSPGSFRHATGIGGCTREGSQFRDNGNYFPRFKSR